ncbi:MAG: DUF1549 domain-containing protein [Acidobacteriota bacterium]
MSKLARSFVLAVGWISSALPLFGRANDCTFDPARAVPSPILQWRLISTRAESVAPTQVVSGRRRAANPATDPLSRNFIDAEILGKMKSDGVRWTVPAGDEEFLRRLTIDLTGEIPEVETVKAFVADGSPGKRDAAIERLLASEAFADRWAMWLGDLVQNVFQSANSAEYIQGRHAFAEYLRQSIGSRKALDQIVRELITGSGGSFHDGQTAYWVRAVPTNASTLPAQDTYDNLSAATGEQFLGLPLQCVSCHAGLGHLELVNGGLARRSRLDFWKNAAFFAQVITSKRPHPVTGVPETFVTDGQNGEYLLNTATGNKSARQPLIAGQDSVGPAFFLTGETPRAGEGRRQAYARIITAHPQFARNLANRLWKELFALAIVEPVNGFDLSRQDPSTLPAGASLQPSHPQLLTRLADALAAGGFDLRAFLRTLVQSNAYQLSGRYAAGAWDERWVPYFARHYPQRLMSEALLDAILRATSVGAAISAAPQAAVPATVETETVSKAMALPDPTGGREYAGFLDHFGRGNRDNVTRSANPSVVQALSMMNSRILLERIRSSTGGSTVQKILATESDSGVMAERIYLATLSRYPTSEERATASKFLDGGPVAQRLEDLQFALLNSLEFLFS